MTPFVAYLAAVTLGLIVSVVVLEISDGREHDRRRRADDYAEFDAWLRARDITGRSR